MRRLANLRNDFSCRYVICFHLRMTGGPLSLRMCRALTFGVVGKREQADARGPDPRSENRDAIGISSEIPNIFTDPA